MSENQGTSTNGTTEMASVDPELLAQLMALKTKEDEKKRKLAAAAAERKRTNARGKMPDGTTDRNPAQSYLATLGALLTNWIEMYEEDPASLRRRMVEQLVPSIVAQSNTPSIQMGAGMDARRFEFQAWHVAYKAKAPAATPANACAMPLYRTPLRAVTASSFTL